MHRERQVFNKAIVYLSVYRYEAGRSGLVSCLRVLEQPLQSCIAYAGLKIEVAFRSVKRI